MFRLMQKAVVIIGLISMMSVGGLVILSPQVSSDGQIIYVVSLFAKLQLYTSHLSRNLTVRVHQSTNSNDYQPTVSSATGDVVFVSDRLGDTELFMLSATGHYLRQLTDNDHDDLYPQWSPDGKAIIYQSNPDGLSQFFLMDADGTNSRQLTDIPQAVARPWWSPDGTQITYDSGGEIYSYDIASAKAERLTDDSFWDQLPSWSPDGDVIVYESNRGADWRLYSINLLTRDLIPISQPDRTDQHITWTDEPQQIIFQSTRQFPGRLYTLNLDNPQQIDVIMLPPQSGSSLYLLFGIRDVLEHDWTDVIEPEWIRRN